MRDSFEPESKRQVLATDATSAVNWLRPLIRRVAMPARVVLRDLSGALFLARNLWCARSLPPFSPEDRSDIALGPLKRRQLADIEALYSRFHDGSRLAWATRWLLRLAGDRYCLVACDRATDRVVGMALYYFNCRDRRENTIHEGFTGVAPEQQSRGIGTALRRHALVHFARCGLRGVSSRVSVTNEASLKSNFRLGFQVVEQYYDAARGEERYYLVCRFDGASAALRTENKA